MSLVALFFARRLLPLLLAEALLQRRRYVTLSQLAQHIILVGVAHVHEHVGVGGGAECDLVGLAAAEVGRDGVSPRAPTHHLVVELEPHAVQLRADEDHVVAAVVVAAVHEDRVQAIESRRALLLVQVVVQLDLFEELVAIVDFYVAVSLWVVL